MKGKMVELMLEVTPERRNGRVKLILFLLFLNWYMTSLNIISENSYDTYMRKQYGVETIYYKEERRTYYVVGRQFEFQNMSYTGSGGLFYTYEETDYHDVFGNVITYRFYKVAGIPLDVTDHEANNQVFEKKKLNNEQPFDD